jgi:hypothetical protein
LGGARVCRADHAANLAVARVKNALDGKNGADPASR